MIPAILLTAWVTALFLPVATVDHLNEDQTFSGWLILLLGFLGPLILQFSAYANPLFLAVLLYVAVKRQRAAPRLLKLAAGVLALALMNALFWVSVPDDSGFNPINHYHAGYHLWLGVMGATVAWLLWLSRLARISPE